MLMEYEKIRQIFYTIHEDQIQLVFDEGYVRSFKIITHNEEALASFKLINDSLDGDKQWAIVINKAGFDAIVQMVVNSDKKYALLNMKSETPWIRNMARTIIDGGRIESKESHNRSVIDSL